MGITQDTFAIDSQYGNNFETLIEQISNSYICFVNDITLTGLCMPGKNVCCWMKRLSFDDRKLVYSNVTKMEKMKKNANKKLSPNLSDVSEVVVIPQSIKVHQGSEQSQSHIAEQSDKIEVIEPILQESITKNDKDTADDMIMDQQQENSNTKTA